MKRTLILAATIASLGAPVLADSALEFAIDHFNQSVESKSDIRTVPAIDNTTFVSTRNSSALGTAFDILNQSADRPSDLRGVNGATVVSNTPAYGADIFAALRAESLEDE